MVPARHLMFTAVLATACGQRSAARTAAGEGGEEQGKRTGEDQSTLEGTICKAIELLEAGNYRALFEEIAHPDEVKKLHSSGLATEEVIKNFEEQGKAEILLRVLRDIQHKEPAHSEDGSVATFELADELKEIAPSDRMIFVMFEGKWYLTD